ncbi:methionyl-tRNA formyltransferase [Xanthobacter agilis]|uniref:methionyl-tRNA formyltransferase n=1 Tax=Xanthobacter agilis TaxID=47492 RepID=UPI0037296C77
MALIANFVRQDKERFSVHDPIDAQVSSFQAPHGRIVQIDTFGRGTRENPGKISQTIQLDKTSGEELFRILQAEFDLI